MIPFKSAHARFVRRPIWKRAVASLQPLGHPAWESSLPTFGALLGVALGYGWSALWPGVPLGFFALLGAGAVLSATTQGPISADVLMLELTGRDRSFILPLILIAALSTLIARSVEPRSIYDARLSDEQIESRQNMREQEPNEIGIPQ